MTQKIFIRNAKQSDISTLVDYNQALANETENIELNEKVLQSGIEKALKLRGCHYFIAELDDKIVGQSMITGEWSDWRNGFMWWIQSVYVHPGFRKRGVFTSLLKYIEDLAKKKSEVKGLRLYVMKNNQGGINAYENLGMKNSGYVVYEKSH